MKKVLIICMLVIMGLVCTGCVVQTTVSTTEAPTAQYAVMGYGANGTLKIPLASVEYLTSGKVKLISTNDVTYITGINNVVVISSNTKQEEKLNEDYKARD